MAENTTPQQDQDTPSKWVKVRAKVQRGIIRAGVHWPQTESFEFVSPSQLEQLKSESLLEVVEVSEGDIPKEKRRVPAPQQTSEEAQRQHAELLKNAEFPNRGQAPSGQPTRVGVQPTSSVPIEPQGPSSAPNDDASGSDKLSVSAGLDDTRSGKKHR